VPWAHSAVMSTLQNLTVFLTEISQQLGEANTNVKDLSFNGLQREHLSRRAVLPTANLGFREIAGHVRAHTEEHLAQGLPEQMAKGNRKCL
jgi:hypothetical protein